MPGHSVGQEPMPPIINGDESPRHAGRREHNDGPTNDWPCWTGNDPAVMVNTGIGGFGDDIGIWRLMVYSGDTNIL